MLTPLLEVRFTEKLLGETEEAEMDDSLADNVEEVSVTGISLSRLLLLVLRH